MPKGKRGGRRPAQQAPERPRPWLPILLAALAVAALAGAMLLVIRLGGEAAARASAGLTGDQAPTSSRSAAAAGKTLVSAVDGVVTLPVADLDDGTARFFTYRGSSKTLSFFVLKGSDGVVRAAYDACDVCYAAKKGYRQEGDVMVCNNCGNRFPSVRINVETGGCNPAPLKEQVQGGQVIIKAADIEAGARYF